MIARVVKETGVLINAEKANIDSMAGEVLIDVPDSDVDLVRRRLAEMGVAVRVMENAIARTRLSVSIAGPASASAPRRSSPLMRNGASR